MNEENTMSIEDLETAELGRLYTEMEDRDPTSDEYSKIIASCKTIRYGFNESNKYWSEKERLEFEREKLDKEIALKQDELDIRKKELENAIRQSEIDASTKEKELRQAMKMEIARNIINGADLVVKAGLVVMMMVGAVKGTSLTQFRDAMNFLFKKRTV